MRKSIGINLLLAFASTLTAVALVEVALRTLHPVYEQAAGAAYGRDDVLIWAPRANERDTKKNPDTGVRLPVIYNDLALRQSRNFDDLESATTLAFFGDSFTENKRLPSPYSFQEVLDYLLNRSAAGFQVMNFGVDGYGTDQAYLRYLAFEQRGELDHVFYVFCANDLSNIYETGLYSLGEDGQLRRNPVPKPRWWVRFVSRLHVTYLVLDLRQRLVLGGAIDATDFGGLAEQTAMMEALRERAVQVQEQGLGDERLDRSVRIFRRLLQEWRRDVESHGGRFHVVLLPKEEEARLRGLIDRDFDVIDLYELFRERVENYAWEDITFVHDGHWAEEGNRLAAMALYRRMADELGLPDLSDPELERALQVYYAAFSYGWQPASGGSLSDVPQEELRAIRGKYAALEMP
jgi:lysophospholipase L1-like esterase